jgi:hypothetical protein
VVSPRPDHHIWHGTMGKSAVPTTLRRRQESSQRLGRLRARSGWAKASHQLGGSLASGELVPWWQEQILAISNQGSQVDEGGDRSFPREARCF